MLEVLLRIVSAVSLPILLFTGLFLIVLILIQRGKGGGLAGAFGGMGGQSAFGTKAGDLFTRITIGVATFWILMCILTVWAFGRSASTPLGDVQGGTERTAPENPGSGDSTPEK